MEDKTQKLITIDPTLWRRFKARSNIMDVTITELLERVIEKFLEGKSDDVKEVKKPKPLKNAMTKKAGTESLDAVREDKTVEEEPERPELDVAVKLEDATPEEIAVEEERKTPTRKDRFRGNAGKRSVDKDLLKHARAFSIPVEDKKEEDLFDEVLDAIENDYREHKKLGEKAFGEYLDRERSMLEWFNDSGGKER